MISRAGPRGCAPATSSRPAPRAAAVSAATKPFRLGVLAPREKSARHHFRRKGCLARFFLGFWRGVAVVGRRVEAATLEQRLDARLVAGECTEQVEGFYAAAARQERLAEAVAVLAREHAVLLERLGG